MSFEQFQVINFTLLMVDLNRLSMLKLLSTLVYSCCELTQITLIDKTSVLSAMGFPDRVIKIIIPVKKTNYSVVDVYFCHLMVKTPQEEEEELS